MRKLDPYSAYCEWMDSILHQKAFDVMEVCNQFPFLFASWNLPSHSNECYLVLFCYCEHFWAEFRMLLCGKANSESKSPYFLHSSPFFKSIYCFSFIVLNSVSSWEEKKALKICNARSTDILRLQSYVGLLSFSVASVGRQQKVVESMLMLHFIRVSWYRFRLEYGLSPYSTFLVHAWYSSTMR